MRVTIATSVILATLVAVSCAKTRTSGGGGGAVSSADGEDKSDTTVVSGTPDSGSTPDGGKVTHETPVRAKVRNFEQYLYSMEAITGIKVSDPTVITGTTTVDSIFKGNKDNLPGSSRLAETAPVNVKAYADVAAGFAQRLFIGADATAVAARTAFLGSDVTVGPDQYFTDQVLSDMVKKVWGGNVDAASIPTYVGILKTLINDLKATDLPVPDRTTPAGTKKLLVAVYAVLAASDMAI